MPKLATSVLIPSYRRPDRLQTCLSSLARQTQPPEETFVIWQGDDSATQSAAETMRAMLPSLRILHLEQPGIVPAENLALRSSQGDLIMLIDDDAVAPQDWVERHCRHYEENERLGAVGGPAVNHRPDDSPFPVRAVEPIGKLTWFGKPIGNMHDHPEAWRHERSPIRADHLVGYNLSFRRAAIHRFEDRLRPYWQMFEMDACLQVARDGWEVRFDFGNIVDHYPSNALYAEGRAGNLEIKVLNAAYNHAFILSKHTRERQLRWARWLYLFGLGSPAEPGLGALPVAIKRYGQPLRELRLLLQVWQAHRQGWIDGRKAKRELSGQR